MLLGSIVTSPVAFGYTPAGYKPHVERQLFGFEYRLGRRDGLFRETQTILRDNVIVLIAQRELRFLNIGRVNGLILAELDPYMVYLVYYLLRPVNRECFGIKNKFLRLRSPRQWSLQSCP